MKIDKNIRYDLPPQPEDGLEFAVWWGLLFILVSLIVSVCLLIWA
jgi:hypothetical protein